MIRSQDPLGRFLFVGTGGKHIYVYKLEDLDHPESHTLIQAIPSEVPSFVTLHPSKRFLYACNELETAPTGSVSAFSVDAESGRLTWISTVPTKAPGPCHAQVHPSGEFLGSANYHGVSSTIFAIDPKSGALSPTDIVVHTYTGKGPHPDRQECSHPHQFHWNADGSLAYVADLGLDRIHIHPFSPESHHRRAASAAAATAAGHTQDSVVDLAVDAIPAHAPGSGPRVMAFHPASDWVYLITELDSHIHAYSIDPSSNGWTLIQSLPLSASNQIGASGIEVSADGRYVFASMRADENTLSVFRIDPDTGLLTQTCRTSTLGEIPRHFALVDDRWLVVANQISKEIRVFRFDRDSETLVSVGAIENVPECPQSIAFL
ncbi:Lactonase, 7-bladed beta-propeller-domain-containing protein [Polychytrium aggregatum]|uniref:Lactonase, 7-bladed beta-propeller-domain-containing protein n=1 Tax=Polychytrium aggregatum TaxID=110093 RepID=UPI0022FE319C|nr:Lactonase, 7-bladed beta-propeller-domain-containing protein [Polychytrium aggregatum]KAI9190833.1 Lactonase, 7-bladed beta-propeller-domain-containing protein [Polychytrium aggregatum]